MTQGQTFGDLLGRTAALLEEMATQCHDIENMAVLWHPGGRPDSPDRAESLIAFQKLDQIAQSLHDLSSLSRAISTTSLADMRIDPRFLRNSLRLRSLADRLLNEAPEAQDHDDFLL